MVLGGKPACHNIRIKVIDGFEVIIGGKAGIELKSEMVAGGKEKDSRDMSDAMLMEDVTNHDTIGNIMDGVFGIWDGGNGLVILNADGIIIVTGDDFTGMGRIGATGVLSNRDLSLVGSCITDGVL